LKKFTLLFTVLSLFLTIANGQTSSPTHRTCATDQAMQKIFDNDPQARARYAQMQKDLEAQLHSGQMLRTNAITTVPVVVHIVLPDPNLVTNATVQNQLDTLNWFYGAASTTDSLRVYTPFRTSYGRSNVRFCLAVRDPNNLPSTGINRITSSTVFNAGGSHPSSEAPAWNTTQYLNIWVCQLSGGVLGYSYLPGTFAPGDQRAGFVNDYRAFGSNASYLISAYNKGRTAVHEIGHYFNLLHPWGNGAANASCTQDDGCTDTPPTNGPTYGCPSTPVLNSCSATAPGVMSQNHMDYADDACMYLFTQCQATRINNSLTAADRIGLSTSLGCQPFAVQPYDAAITSIVSPTAGQSFCGATTITPQVNLANFGTVTLTSATITISVNGGAPVNNPWTGSLAQNNSIAVTLPAIAALGGTNSLTICVTNINGGQADGTPGNNCQTVSYANLSVTPLPIVEGFESTTFPPTGWAVINPNSGSITWTRTTTAAKTGVASARINIFNYSDVGHKDYLRSPLVNFAAATADSAFVTFQYAYRRYDDQSNDTLEVLVSKDCGATWTTMWIRGGQSLVTGSQAFITANFVPTAAEWTQTPIRVDLSQFVGVGSVYVAFRSTNEFGQNIYIDDVNIFTRARATYDAFVKSINVPLADLCDQNSFTPTVRIGNNGRIPLTSLKVSYSFDNGTAVTTALTGINLAVARDTVVILPAISNITLGSHTIKYYTSEPNGVADQNTANDTLFKAFKSFAATPAPLVEGFETGPFPPAGWDITQQPVDGTTWSRIKVRRTLKDSTMAAYLNNYSYSSLGSIDNLITPPVKYAGVDSVTLSFDVSASTKSYPGSTSLPLDTLEVLVSRDCGATYTSIYKKHGSDLQTIGEPNTANTDEFFPLNERQWRRDSINLTSLLGTSNSVRFMFRNVENFENNIFIDNINLRTKIVPARVKANGFMIAPNPFSSSFIIQHYLAPTDLRSYGVYNSIGQQVLSQSFGEGTADSYIQVNMARFAAGVYTVKLVYNNRTVSQKIIKTN
jgi:hypothetical protein